MSMDLFERWAAGEEEEEEEEEEEVVVVVVEGGRREKMYSRGVLLEYTLICGTWGT